MFYIILGLKTINNSNIHCIKYFVPNSNTRKTLPLEYVVVQTILCTPSMLTGYQGHKSFHTDDTCQAEMLNTHSV